MNIENSIELLRDTFTDLGEKGFLVYLGQNFNYVLMREDFLNNKIEQYISYPNLIVEDLKEIVNSAHLLDLDKRTILLSEESQYLIDVKEKTVTFI